MHMKHENVQITPFKYSNVVHITPTILYFSLIYPSNYAIWFKLPHDAIYHFCFCIHKLDFNFGFYKVIVDIIIYFKQFFDKIFIIKFL
jgi:hypothetical protein